MYLLSHETHSSAPNIKFNVLANERSTFFSILYFDSIFGFHVIDKKVSSEFSLIKWSKNYLFFVMCKKASLTENPKIKKKKITKTR